MNALVDQTNQENISLVDIYRFCKDGWKTVAVTAIVGLGLGVTTAFVMPEKFQATALIEPARVAVVGQTSITDKPLESKEVLLEKMKSPTYYTDQTVQACGLSENPAPFSALAKNLNPTAGRNSAYVSVSFRAQSPKIAANCLTSVLKDVAQNQALLAAPLINTIEVQLQNTSLELQATTTERDQQRIKNVEKLNVSKQKLLAAQDFVSKFEKNSLNFNFDDPRFSASALLLSTLISKQNEIKDLEIQISALEMEVAANMTNKDQEVRRLATRVNELKNALAPPSTKPATFAAPVYAPDTRVEPKRGMLALVGLVAGGFLGFLLLLGRRLYKHLQQELDANKT